MSKYEVKLLELVEHTVTVEAGNEDEARDLGYSIIMNGRDSEYSTESHGTHGLTIVKL